MNVTLPSTKNPLPAHPKHPPKKKPLGMSVTLHKKQTLPSHNNNPFLAKLNKNQSTSQLDWSYPFPEEQPSNLFNTCCQEEKRERNDTETDMPKKYITPINPLTLNLHVIGNNNRMMTEQEVIYLPHDFSLAKTQESSSKECNGSLWNIDSPVNRLY